MDGKDWLLLFISAPVGKDLTSVDPIRIMKGMFYFVKESLESDIYNFEPYHLGPVSFDIYKDLDELISNGLVNTENVPGETWKRYYPSPSGLIKAEELKTGATPLLVSALNEHKNRLCSLGFIELLRQVYKEYPDFAKESIFRFS